MLIQNKSKSHTNYDTIITNCTQNAKNLDLMVSYVRTAGFNNNLFNNKNIRLICSLDMGITDINSLINLIKVYKANIKICKLSQGTFHSKLFIFDNKEIVIGSANITRSAMQNNVETGIYLTDNKYVKDGKKIFEQFWKDSNEIKIEDLEILKISYDNKKKINKSINNIILKPPVKSTVINKIILSFIQHWSGVKRSLRGKGEITNIWRGWYIIPDQGYITNSNMDELKKVCQFVSLKGGKINIKKGSVDEPSLENFLKSVKVLKRSSHKMTYRGRFIRGDKNYMVKLGLAEEINGELILTKLGNKLVNSKNVTDIKNEYTEIIESVQFYGLNIFNFLKDCLLDLDKFITLEEYNWFMQHAQSYSDKEVIINIIKIYRLLSDSEKAMLRKKIKGKLNSNLEDGRNKSIVGNYNKSAGTNISALGWCTGLNYDESTEILTMK